MSGEIDYLLRVVVPVTPRCPDVSSSFAMEQLKYTTALPLQYV